MRGAAAVLAGALLRGSELAGAGRNGTPGLGLACGLAGEGLRGARDPLVGSARCDGDRAWLRDGDGGSTRRSSPARECFVVLGLGF